MSPVDHRLSRRQVAGLEPFDRLQALHEAAYLELDGNLSALTPGMRALSVLFAFVGDVENGGFSAAMYNSTGDLTAEAIAAAKLVGAARHAEVFERFMQDAMLGDPSMSWEARVQRLESMSEEEAAALELLDEELFALPSIDTVLQTYVEQHPDEFFRD